MKKLIFLVIFIQRMCYADISSLQNGIGITDKNIYTIAPTSIEYAIARKVHRLAGDDGVSAFINIPDIVRLYSISRKLNLYLTKFDTREVLGNWPLTRWEHHLDYIERTSRQNDLSINNGDYTIDIRSPLGCLNATPLRYGDVDGDGTNEIVLVLGNDLVVFSAEQRRIVFSVSFNLFDWMPSEETHYLYEDEGGEYLKPDSEPQYASALFNTYRLQRENIKGYRGYSKLFEGDFDEDGFADFLIWQKVYESKLERDSVRGFDQVRNEFMHYERDLTAQAESEAGVTGEYLPQDTPEADIQKWLAENSLTWSKGYPSKSECAGEEGQSIPEMHDPLLNDPEVLQ